MSSDLDAFALMYNLAGGSVGSKSAQRKWDARWGSLFKRAIGDELTKADEATLLRAMEKSTKELKKRPRSPRTTLGKRLGQKIKILELELTAAKDAVLRPLGVTVPQYTALLAINDEPFLSGAELARRCLVTPQTMTTVLGHLTLKGYIERRSVPGQGRAKETTITTAGKRILAKADKEVLAVEKTLAGTMAVKDQATFAKLLDQARAPFTKEEAAPKPVKRAVRTTAKKTAKKAPAKKTAAAKAAPAKKAAAKKTVKKAAAKKTVKKTVVVKRHQLRRWP